MQKVRILAIFFIGITFSSGLAKAQSGSEPFLTFDQFFQNYSLFNPASPDSSGKLFVKLGHSFLQGLFEGVNRSYFDAEFKPGKSRSLSYSRIGLLVQSSNFGGFINRTRYYGRYSRTIALGNDNFLSVGLGLGAVTISLRGSQSFAGGSSTAFDGYTGFWYYRNKIKVGLSLEQFAQSVLTPIQESFKLDPIVNFNAIYSSNLSPSVNLSNHLYIHKGGKDPILLEYAPVLLLSDIIQTGVNFKLKRGIAILAGIDTHTPGLGNISFMGSFLLGTRKLSTSSDNKFEISARYWL